MYNSLYKLSTFFLKLAQDYEFFRDKVEELSKQNPYPFSSWFNSDGRVFIDFQKEFINYSADDETVINELEDNGYKVIDYVGGYCELNGRKFKIGKVLNLLLKLKIKELEEKKTDQESYEDKKLEIEEYFKNLNIKFSSSKARSASSQKGLSIVISQNPHDVAKMSTDRGWTSCMKLTDGAHKDDVFLEVQGGGLVAYLIRPEDINIEHPFARIHIRRFTSDEGENLAVPEDTVYGTDVPGFKEAVENWLNNKQPGTENKIYTRMGGEWSDTFEKYYYSTPNDPDKLLDLTEAEKNKSFIKKEYSVVDHIMDSDIEGKDRSKSFPTKELAENYIKSLKNDNEVQQELERMHYELWEKKRYEAEENDEEFDYDYYGPEYYELAELFNNRFSIEEENTNTFGIVKDFTLNKLISIPKDKISKQHILRLKQVLLKNIDANKDMIIKFIEKHPEEFYERDVNVVIEFLDDIEKVELLKVINPEIKNKYLNTYEKDIINILNDHSWFISNEKYTPGNRFEKWVSKPIELFNELSSTLISELIKFANFIYDSDEVQPYSKDNILKSIIHIFYMKKVNDNVIKDLYIKLMNSFENPKGINFYPVFDISSIGLSLAKMGKDGQEFLPKLKEYLAACLEVYKTNKNTFTKRKIEQTLYVIDSIENGTGKSKKYNYF